jgi:hypothetical protein
MRSLTVCVFRLLCVLALPAAAAQDAALRAVDACITRLDTEIDVGFVRVAARCPELPGALRASAWVQWLPATWSDGDNNLSAKSLEALRALVARELALSPPAAAPQVARLRPILAQLAIGAAERLGWWARLHNWLRGVFARSAPAERDGAFARLFGRVSLSDAVLECVAFMSVALVLALAALIVVNEWRAAGLRAPWVRNKPSDGAPERKGVPQVSWLDIERAAEAERPRMLLALLVARLTAARRLPSCAALTVRELARAAQLGDAEDRSRLLEVALAAERLRYSGRLTEPAGLATAIERGRELLERLNASSVTAS